MSLNVFRVITDPHNVIFAIKMMSKHIPEDPRPSPTTLRRFFLNFGGIRPKFEDIPPKFKSSRNNITYECSRAVQLTNVITNMFENRKIISEVLTVHFKGILEEFLRILRIFLRIRGFFGGQP